MTQSEFRNRLLSLFNIDGDCLPELTFDEQIKFVDDPVNYYRTCSDDIADAIWREIEKRQVRILGHELPIVGVINVDNPKDPRHRRW